MKDSAEKTIDDLEDEIWELRQDINATRDELRAEADARKETNRNTLAIIAIVAVAIIVNAFL